MTRVAMALMLLVAMSAGASAANLVVRFEGVRAEGGSLRVGLFDSADGFALRAMGVVERRTLRAEGGTLAVAFEGLMPGRYAVTAFHDANDNNRLDRLLGLVPREGVALTNDPPLIRKPSFDDIAVEVERDTEVAVTLVYPVGG